MDYGSEVRRRFRAPARFGDIPPGSGDVVEGAAEDRSLNIWVRFQIRVERETLRQIRFHAYGCPYTLAAADWIAEHLEERPVSALAGLDMDEVAARISLPRDRYGKLLRIEDALIKAYGNLNNGKRS